MDKWITLQTLLSQAYWCRLQSDRRAVFARAEVEEDREVHSVSWFDEMFYGGIRFPQVKDRPATILIAGAPGTGKSTLALELCYRLANIEIPTDHDSREQPNAEIKTTPWLSLYVSADSNAAQVYQKALDFGWRNAQERFYTGSSKLPDTLGVHGLVAIRGAESLKKEAAMRDAVKQVLSDGIDILEFVPRELVPGAPEFAVIAKKLHQWMFTTDPVKKAVRAVMPDVVVVDSLNTLTQDERASYFDQFVNAATGHTRIVVFILDTHGTNTSHAYWEYMCDFVIRVGGESTKNYFLRNIEIVKARFQDHVLGKQQMKIYPGKCTCCSERYGGQCKQMPDGCVLDAKTMRRGHPYRHEGGIFIYPSIHYYLSKYKRKAPDVDPTFADTRPEKLNTIIKRGDGITGGIFPEGRCTAFVGGRGGHKSHLGYLHLLHRLRNHKESALVVSLRDDEEMTKTTMRNILTQEFGERDPRARISEYETMDKIEILYYPPGYITPEEFFHRMFMSVYRMKRANSSGKLTVLFNSLDQLAARFPLCAEQDIFVPGIIASLTGENATSIFIAVDEPGQPEKQYGLIPMADLVLSFRRWRFTYADYLFHLSKNEMTKAATELGCLDADSDKKDQQRDTVLLEILRFAGGERAGTAGILELVTDAGLSLYPRAGLHFVPLVPGLSPGKPVSE